LLTLFGSCFSVRVQVLRTEREHEPRTEREHELST
jgi:hypothetical protein